MLSINSFSLVLSHSQTQREFFKLYLYKLQTAGRVAKNGLMRISSRVTARGRGSSFPVSSRRTGWRTAWSGRTFLPSRPLGIVGVFRAPVRIVLGLVVVLLEAGASGRKRNRRRRSVSRFVARIADDAKSGADLALLRRADVVPEMKKIKN